MRHLIFPTLLSLGLLTTGCDPATAYVFDLRNGTDTTAIRLQAAMSTIGPLDTIIQPGKQISLGQIEEIGVDAAPPAIIHFFEDLVITNLQGDTCKRDPMQNATWDIETEQVGRRIKSYRNDYELLVLEEDFL
jgi:hypothetical protein